MFPAIFILRRPVKNQRAKRQGRHPAHWRFDESLVKPIIAAPNPGTTATKWISVFGII